jgi:hypothetical protein
MSRTKKKFWGSGLLRTHNWPTDGPIQKQGPDLNLEWLNYYINMFFMLVYVGTLRLYPLLAQITGGWRVGLIVLLMMTF